MISHEVIHQFIGSTATTTRLEVRCCLDENEYPKAVKVSDLEMDAINISRDDFHGEWNYTIAPMLTLPNDATRPGEVEG